MRYSSLQVVFHLLSVTSAFPGIEKLVREGALAPRGPIDISTEPNSGFFPNTGFDPKDQYVDVSPGSEHEWRAPGPSDIRGPCPGLNAAANHGFISRSGILSLQDTTVGLQNAYNFGVDFSAPLFVFSTLNSGSLLDMAWSIGGPMPSNTLGGILGAGMGISNSHNKYEGDASPGRGDAYLHNGDAHSLNINNYGDMYNLAKANGGKVTLQTLRQHNKNAFHYSLNNNPYFFSGPFFFVPPIAHQFIAAMMSNHSAEDVQGVLTTDVLNSFFSVKENADGSLTWVPGHERIPDNWYRRPSSNPYGVVASFGDFALQVQDFPELASIGGNTGTPNSFTGVDLADLTGGVFNAQTLLQGNNLACFAFQATLAILPEATTGILNAATPFFQLANSIIEPLLSSLACPQLSQFNEALLSNYPGYTYKEPVQPAQSY